jgi:regulator of ribosome biosynthesis
VANTGCYRELFAKKKGIKAKKKDGKLVYDEEKQEWVPKWGYKGKNKEVEDQWLVEVDDKKTTADGEEANPRKLSRDERKRNIKLNERQEKKNRTRGPATALAPKKGAGVGKKRK